MRVFVTGGTGLLGSHLAAELRDHGAEVVALCRRGRDTSFLVDAGCTVVEGDIRDDPETLTDNLERCTHIVHGAALVYAGGEWPKIRAVNVDGTRNVLTAAVRAGVEHAVHVSSVAAYGPVEGPVTEETPTDTDLAPDDLYARSKREAEEVAVGIEEKRGLPITIVRPAAVFGERDRLMAPALADILRLPLVPLFGSGSNTVPAVYAGNVAGALRLVLEAGRGNTVYDIGDDYPVTQRQLMEGLASGMGRKPRFFSLPEGLVTTGAEVLGHLGTKMPGAKHLQLDRLARLATGDNPYGSERLRAELGWEPRFEPSEALERTGRWLADHRRRNGR